MVRHGEADNNVTGIINSNRQNSSHLTEKGKEQAGKAGDNLKAKNRYYCELAFCANEKKLPKYRAEVGN